MVEGDKLRLDVPLPPTLSHGPFELDGSLRRRIHLS